MFSDRVPPNCVFEVDDYESPWVYQTPFDFIHGRELEGCVADEDKLFRQAFEHLKPGGYFEFDGSHAVMLSDDGTHEKAPNFQLFADELREAGRRFGKSFDNVPLWKEKMEKAGFTGVTEWIAKVPLRPWPKDEKLREIGKYQQVQQMLGVESYTPGFFSRVLGWKNDEIQVLIANIRKELSDKSIHAYINTHFVYGRKPE
ncbi:hypothetical protein Plec18167_004111 [Paecilomyces lecythidis]|uniref:S-adenosyl-L-methionine-dependent methyltransferase n=1 Tax=Paecilomyces lecythidis TaxID=3004212 RepID=A0ABR3XVR5_9EURO